MSNFIKFKRTSGISDTLEQAKGAIAMIATSCEDGEIVLARYYKGDKVLTLQGTIFKPSDGVASSSITYSDRVSDATQESIEAVSGAITNWVEEKQYLQQADLKDYATTGYVDSMAVEASGNAKSWVEAQNYITGVNLSNYATTGYVDSMAVEASGNAKSWVEAQNYITGVDLSNYATTGYVNQQDQALSGAVTGWVDTNYITNDKARNEFTNGIIKASGAAQTWVEAQHYITGVDLSDYATTGYVNQQDQALSGVVTGWVESQGYSKGGGSGSGVDQAYVDSKAAEASGSVKSWVEEQKYITGVDLSNYALSADVNTLVSEVSGALETKITTVSGDVLTTEDVTVLGTTAGVLKSGDVINKGTSLTDFLKKLLIKVVDCTAVAPTLSLAQTTALAEVGVIIRQTLTATYSDGKFTGSTANGFTTSTSPLSAGCESGNYTYYKGSTILTSTTANSYTIKSFTVLEGSTSWSATCTYGASTKSGKKNNGETSSVQIASGTAKSSVLYTTGYYKWYKFNVAADASSDYSTVCTSLDEATMSSHVGYAPFQSNETTSIASWTSTSSAQAFILVLPSVKKVTKTQNSLGSDIDADSNWKLQYSFEYTPTGASTAILYNVYALHSTAAITYKNITIGKA